MRFCNPGTFSSGISTPRSPRATIRPSEISTISSSFVIACGFSIFDITEARPRGQLLDFNDIFRALHERDRDPIDAGLKASLEIGAILLGHRRDGNFGIRQADAFAIGNFAGDIDNGDGMSLVGDSDMKAHFAVIDEQRMAGRNARKISGWGRQTRFWSPSAGLESNVNVAPLASLIARSLNAPMRSFGPCKSSRMPMGRPNSLWTSRIIRT